MEQYEELFHIRRKLQHIINSIDDDCSIAYVKEKLSEIKFSDDEK